MNKLLKRSNLLLQINIINITIGALFFVFIDIIFNNFYFELKVIHAGTITAGFIFYFLLTYPNHFRLSFGVISFYLFLLVYLVNVLIYTVHHENFCESIKVLLRFVGCTIIPIISLGTSVKINIEKTIQIIYYLLGLFLLISVFHNIPNLNVRYCGFNTLSFSSYGYYCSLFSIISLLLYSVNKKFTYLLSIFVGIFLGLLTGTRAPIISFVICSAVILFYVKDSIRIVKFIVILLLGVVVIFLLNLPIVERFEELVSLSEVSAIQRLELITLALNNFFKNPIFGSELFLSSHYIYYPHNIYVEILSATGLLGFIPLSIFLFFVLRKVYLSVKLGLNMVLNIIWLFFFMQTFFNGSIYWVFPFWIISFMILIIKEKEPGDLNSKKDISNNNENTVASPIFPGRG